MKNFDFIDKTDKSEQIISKARDLHEQGQLQKAIDLFEIFIQKYPDETSLYYNFALFLYQSSLYTESLQIITIVWNRFHLSSSKFSILAADCYMKLGSYDTAIFHYKMTLKLDPCVEGAAINLSALLGLQGNTKQAIEVLALFLENNQSYDACLNLANLQYLSKNYVEAKALYLHCFEWKSQNTILKINLCECLRATCDWELLSKIEDEVSCITKLNISSKVEVIEPALHHLLRCNDFQENYLIAQSKLNQNNRCNFIPKVDKCIHRKYQIGYLSDDFGEHPVAYLLLPILRKHKQAGIQVYLLSYGASDESEIRKKLYNEAFEVINLRDSINKNVDQVRSLNLDIVIDLKGLTLNHRQDLLQKRLAKKQVTFLGYTGTTANPEIDYIIADDMVLGDHNRSYYSETPLYVEKCFMPMNLEEEFNANKYSRSDFCLPDDKVVLLVSVKPSRISKELFNCWVQILKRKENSILWMISYNSESKKQMQSILIENELDQGRIVFCSKPNFTENSFLTRSDHLSRLSLADLVLDSWTYNGHSTTVDAVIAKREVICLRGSDWSSSVSASILTSLGCTYLISLTKDNYLQMALERIQYIVSHGRIACNQIDLTNNSYSFDRWYESYEDQLKSIIDL